MKKHIYILLITLAVVANMVAESVFALNKEEKIDSYTETEVIATAYYSPLPGQSYYLRGNYDAEVRLNGNGTHGASGKEVFPGMLAASKTYTFGTKIWLEGVGTGSVEDRGGAIVNAGKRGYEHDRIDIWMGAGDEGLRRALVWGKRKIKARVYDSGTKISPEVAFDDIETKLGVKKAQFASFSEKVSEKTTTKSGSSLFTIAGDESDELASKIRVFQKQEGSLKKVFEDIGNPVFGETSASVRKLQEALKKTGYLNIPSTAIFGSQTSDAIVEFQLDHKLISDENDPNAGKFGKLTGRALLQEMLFKGMFLNDE